MKKLMVLVLFVFNILCAGRACAEELKIMSYNIRYNSEKDLGENSWEVRKGAVAKLIKGHAPDLVGLQEPRSLQREDLKKALPNYTYLEAPGTGGRHGGNTGLIYRSDKFEAIGSGWFNLGSNPYQLSQSFDAPDSLWRVSIWVQLRNRETGKVFTAISTHLPVRTKTIYAAEPYVKSRFHGSQLNVKRMKELAGEDGVCFILGDMNCSLQSKEGCVNLDGVKALSPYYEWMNDARTLDNHPEINSFNAFGRGEDGPHRKIDHIFYRNVTPVSFTTLTAPVDGLKYVSDHYPIMLVCEY